MKHNSALKILPDDPMSLRAGGAFGKPLNWPPDDRSNLPRALRGLSKIIDGGLCHRCGTCVGICPTGVLSLDDEEYPKVTNLSACTDCDLCVRVCPGDEFNFNEAHERTFNMPGEIRSTHGEFKEALIAYSTNPQIRERSTSGGLVTAILLGLLKSGEIDGAVVVASDPDEKWKGRPLMARTPEDVLSAMKSKYAISPTNAMLGEILDTPGRYAVVGLPCQIHGVVKAKELDPRLKERITLTIGLFCHAAIEHEALRIIWEQIGEKTEAAKAYISRVGKHPGTPHIELEDGSLYPVYFPKKNGYRPSSMEVINIVYRLYTPSRCMTCFDASAEFADIAVGDPWMAPPEDDVDFYQGWSFALARTARGQEVLAQMNANGEIVRKDVTRSEALACNRMMATEKRYRAFRVIETQRRQGKPIPQYGPYGYALPHQSGKQFVKTEIHMLTHIGCYLPRVRGWMLRVMLSNWGYSALWLNSKRRALRFWWRDTRYALRRRLLGRSK